MQGSIARYVANISSETTCAKYVKHKYPKALGATWHDKSGCWAEFVEHMAHSSSHRTCLIQGNFDCINLDIFEKRKRYIYVTWL